MPGGSVGFFDRLARAFSPRPRDKESRGLPDAPGYGYHASNYFSPTEIQSNATVQAVANVIANSVSTLPLNLYFRDPKTGARQKAGWHPLYQILRSRPNPYDSPVVFFGKIIRSMLQKGGAYVWRNYGQGGRLVSLVVLNYESVTIKYQGLQPSYLYNGADHTAEIMYIPSLITDDFGRGYSPLEFARAAVRLGIELDNFSMTAFQNGLNSKLFVDITDMLDQMGVKDATEASKQARIVADYLAAQYAGSTNAGRPLVGLNKFKVQELQHQNSFKDAELLDSRKHQEAEICKIFGVPQFLVNGSMDVKYGGLEAAMTVYLNFCLSPYLKHIENRFAVSLLTPYEQEAYYFEFDFSALLRPDQKSRAEYYSKLFAMGAMSPDDIAAKENLEPDPNGAGTMRFVPANMMPQTPEVQDAYMASAKQKAAELSAGGSEPTDPARATGDDKQ